MNKQVATSAWLRSRTFDHFFIWGIPLIAALSVGAALLRPDLIEGIIFLDLSLLGYHHVIATFTRVKLSSASATENRVLFLYTPVVMLGAVSLVAINWGAIVITTVYLHWQWWHYTRQSEGVAKAYALKTKAPEKLINGAFERFVFYVVPVAAFLSMSSRNPSTFLFSAVYTLPVPSWLSMAVLSVAGLALGSWLLVTTRDLRGGLISPLLYCYYLSHFGIYLFAYHFINDVTLGWLLINIWHNFQYICFVWVCNVNDFGGEGVAVNRIRAWFCQPRNWFFYFAACYFLTKYAYTGVDLVIKQVVEAGWASVPLMVVAYQTINFHHYVVDTFIWKLRKPATRAAVGIQA